MKTASAKMEVIFKPKDEQKNQAIKKIKSDIYDCILHFVWHRS